MEAAGAAPSQASHSIEISPLTCTYSGKDGVLERAVWPPLPRCSVWAGMIPLIRAAAPDTKEPPVDVLTNRYDNSRSGANLRETQLTLKTVNAQQFGKLFERPVDGDAYAQPLIKNAVQIPGLGARNVVFVATTNNSFMRLMRILRVSETHIGTLVKRSWAIRCRETSFGSEGAGRVPEFRAKRRDCQHSGYRRFDQHDLCSVEVEGRIDLLQPGFCLRHSDRAAED